MLIDMWSWLMEYGPSTRARLIQRCSVYWGAVLLRRRSGYFWVVGCLVNADLKLIKYGFSRTRSWLIWDVLLMRYGLGLVPLYTAQVIGPSLIWRRSGYFWVVVGLVQGSVNLKLSKSWFCRTCYWLMKYGIGSQNLAVVDEIWTWTRAPLIQRDTSIFASEAIRNFWVVRGHVHGECDLEVGFEMYWDWKFD